MLFNIIYIMRISAYRSSWFPRLLGRLFKSFSGPSSIFEYFMSATSSYSDWNPSALKRWLVDEICPHCLALLVLHRNFCVSESSAISSRFRGHSYLYYVAHWVFHHSNSAPRASICTRRLPDFSRCSIERELPTTF